MKSDIVVIGGGILGATAAWSLSKEGHRVVILEKGDLVSGASGGNLGKLSVMERQEDWHIPLALESLEQYEELNKSTDIEYCNCGGTMLLQSPALFLAAQQMKEAMDRAGVPLEFSKGESALRHEPNLNLQSIYATVFCPLESVLNPMRATLAFLELAKQHGATVHTHAKVEGFEMSGNTIRTVRSTAGCFPADVVVNAAGSWAGPLCRKLDIHIPVGHHRAMACVTEPIAPCIRTAVLDGSFLSPSTVAGDVCRITIGVAQTAHGSLVISRAAEEADLENKDVSLEGLRRMIQNFLHYFPSLHAIEIVRAWACVTPQTLDDLPVFGFSEKVPNFFIIAGFKGAFGTAPAIGRKVARAIGDGLIWEGGLFSPDRLRANSPIS
ncbi:MAG: FAD-binding oxidoreductase [Fastidiosipila sp.]|jgi:sarcosine oxidase subunit beta|nr:FAD-binding oxidoreductase [Fastidiosipila sp.]